MHTGLCVKLAADYLCEEYIQSRFCLKKDEWPPYHPKHYTTLALIHRKGRCADMGIITVTQGLVNDGNIASTSSKSSSSKCYYSKDISELFSPNPLSSHAPNFVLIEGAPGIGKTVLSKEIAFQWAIHKLLKAKALVFLVFLRDPNLKAITSVEEFLGYLLDSSIYSDLSKHLLKTKGKDLTIIFDGYDELSEEHRINSLVARIISREKLPNCGLVITSRPTASLHLREISDCSVEILGFTEEDRLDYIQHALEGSDTKIKILQSYLQSNLAINALCYIPLNMTILLCVFEEVLSLTKSTNQLNALPSTQTELYQKFIWMIIIRFVKKHDPLFSGSLFNTDIAKLPEQYQKLLMELSQLAFLALKKDNIAFDINDIAEFCPNLTMTSDTWHGLGLLKAVQFVSKVSFHFLHFSIQEYLAASYIAKLPNKMQIELLKTTFWNIRYYNTWIMYIGITSGRNFAWKHFLSGNRFVLFTRLSKTSISKRFLNNKVKCLHLFQCFNEMGGNEIVDNFFENQKIDLSYQSLLPKDISTLGFFLLRSANKHWKVLDLSHCNITDTGCDTLLKMFLEKGSKDTVKIDEVNFSNNGLPIQSALRLLTVFKLWHTMQVFLHENQYMSINNNLFTTCLVKFSQYFDGFVSQVVSITSLVFAYSANVKTIYAHLSCLTNITSIYLNSCKCDKSETQALSKLLKKHSITKLYIIDGDLHENFLNTLIEAVSEIEIVFINARHLCDEKVDNCANMLQCKCLMVNSNLDLSSGWMVIGRNKVLGNVRTSSKQLTISEMVNLLITFNFGHSPVCNLAATYLQKLNLLHNHGNCTLHNLITLWQGNVIKHQISFCILENNILVANGVNSNIIIQILSSTDQIISIYITNCTLNVAKYDEIIALISKQNSLLVLYIYDNFIITKFFNDLCYALWGKGCILKELFLHSNDAYCNLTPALFALIDFRGSAMLVTKKTLAGNNTKIQQVFLLLYLKLKIINTFPTEFVRNVKILNQLLNFVNKSNSEILDFLMGTKSLSSSHLPLQYDSARIELLFFGDQFVFNDLEMLLNDNLLVNQVTFCIADNNILIANGVEYNSIVKVLSSNYHLLSIYIKNCTLSASEYKSIIDILIKKQKSLSVFYIFDTFLETQLFRYFCKKLWNNCSFLKEFFIHSTDPHCNITFDLLTLMHSQTSFMLVTEDSFARHKPSNDQVSLLLQLKLKTATSKSNFLNYQVNVGMLYEFCSFVLGIELNKKHIISEILHVLIRKLTFMNVHALCSGKVECFFYDNRFICNNLMTLLHSSISLYQLSFCTVENNILVAKGVKSDVIIQGLSSNNSLISIFIVNCEFSVERYSKFVNLISEQKALSVLYIFDCFLGEEFFRDISIELTNTNKRLKELFIHTTDPGCSLNCYLLALINSNMLTTFVSKNTFIASNMPSSDHILLLNYLNIHMDFETLYQAPESILGFTGLSTSELLDDLMSAEKSISFTCKSQLNKLVSYKNFRFCNFADFQCSITSLNEATFCIAKDNMLIANRMKFDDIIPLLSSTSQLTSIIIRNCNFCSTEYGTVSNLISKQNSLSECYIFDCYFKVKLIQCISEVVWKGCFCLKELFMHSSNSSCILTFDLIDSLSLKRQTFLVTENAIAGYKPSDKQILFLLRLNPKTDVWSFLNFKGNTDMFHQLVINISGIKLTEKSSTSKILHVLWTKLTSDETSGSSFSKTDFFLHNNKFICNSLMTVLHSNISSCQLSFCIVENNVLIANGVKSDCIIQVLSSNNSLTSIFIANCELSVNQYSTIINLISEQAILSILYIFECILETEFFVNISVKLKNSKLKLKELFIHSVDSAGALKLYLPTLIDPNISTVFASKSVFAATKMPTSDQILLLNYLNIYTKIETLGQVPKSISRISTSKLLDNLMSRKKTLSLTTYTSHFSRFFNLETFEWSKICLNEVNFCITENNMLIANKMNCDDLIPLLSSTNQFTSIIIKNCEFFVEKYDTICYLFSKQKLLSECYIFDSSFKLSFIRNVCLALHKVKVKELFMHSTNSSCFLTSDLFTSIHLDTSTLFATKKAVVANNPNCKQISLSFQLEPNITVWNISNCHAGVITSYPIVHNILTNTSTNILELSITECSFNTLIKLFTFKQSILKWKKVHFSISVQSHQARNSIASYVYTLNKIDLSFIGLQTDFVIELLKSTSTLCLTKLDISHNNITDKAAKTIGNYLFLNTNLVKLNLSYNRLNMEGIMKIFEPVKNMSSLSKFTINDDYNVAIALFNNGKLENYHLICEPTNESVDNEFRSIRNSIIKQAHNQMALLKSKEIDLSYNNIYSADTTTIVARLHFSGLTTVTFVSIPKYAANNIPDFISHNHTLKELNLFYEIPGLIKSMIGSFKSLTKFNICYCDITDQKASEISKLLCHNSQLQELNLSHNHLQTASVIKIIETLNGLMTDLTIIDISYNDLCDQAANHIGLFLSQNNKLEEINLSYNGFQGSGMMKIVEEMTGLVTNVTRFDISHNNVTDEAASDIVLFAFHNTGLKELNLSHNCLSDNGISEILELTVMPNLDM